MRLLLAGATGLVGGLFLESAESAGHTVTSVGRRSIGRSGNEILTDFSEPTVLPQADAAICCLGTTIRSAGSRHAFYAVDHDAVMTFAASALTVGVPHFLIVTAVGASTRATAFYSRVKGEVERDLAQLGFERLDIVQPGLLLGARDEHRPVERFLQIISPALNVGLVGGLSRWGAIEAQTVASALLSLCDERATGVYRHQNGALRAAC